MTGRGGGGGGRRVLLPPINMIFKLLQSVSRLDVYLFNDAIILRHTAGDRGRRRDRLVVGAGNATGFDEFMNLVIDDAVEVAQVTKTNDKETRRPLGQILLKGDNVSLIQNLSS
ncbi:hypothetical protein C2857_001262 [Epichloe festucae Fl1]|uniref:Small nuclear ribonucleoprotein E n=1 Tax=Epichloe festucae (strain Fl1) TaxID=877507 RepID=A0A7S9PTH9_EPIFF|nr:hypothetical protein C2857_001262 [Epichloe festucae Fl1]